MFYLFVHADKEFFCLSGRISGRVCRPGKDILQIFGEQKNDFSVLRDAFIAAATTLSRRIEPALSCILTSTSCQSLQELSLP